MNRAEELIADLEAEIVKRDARIAELERYRTAFNEWHDKTQWVQEEVHSGVIGAKSLGYHRADVMAELIKSMRAELEQKRGGVVLPERIKTGASIQAVLRSIGIDGEVSYQHTAEIWNACLDEVARLNQTGECVAVSRELLERAYQAVHALVSMSIDGYTEQHCLELRALLAQQARVAATQHDAELIELLEEASTLIECVTHFPFGEPMTPADTLRKACSERLRTKLAALAGIK